MLTATIAANRMLEELERDGIALLPDFLSPPQLQSMLTAFESKLRHQRWNDVDGYERTERFRHMVQDVLTLDQGFVDAALHPAVTETLHGYLGPDYELVEAKGWMSLATNRDFHGWHGDAWYDQEKVANIPREVKLGIYLTDVTSGFLEYIRGSHRKQAPKPVSASQLASVDPGHIIQIRAKAGSGFLFDTSGIHRQSVPVLERRYAVFLNYHNASIPLQREDIDYYRYHPLVLNAAFLGGLSAEQQRILGFGNKQNYVHAFARRPRHPRLQRTLQALFGAQIFLDNLAERVRARVRRLSNPL